MIYQKFLSHKKHEEFFTIDFEDKTKHNVRVPFLTLKSLSDTNMRIRCGSYRDQIFSKPELEIFNLFDVGKS